MMKNIAVALFSLAVVTTGAPALQAAAQDAKPDFTGKWTLDLSKSDFGQMPVPESMVSVIDHKEPTVKISTTQKSQQGEITSERTLTTDGKPNTNKVKNMMGEQEMASTTTWEGKKLITISKFSFQDTPVTVNESWDLSADGKMLTVARNIQTGQGDFSQTSVFAKQ